MGVYRFYGPDTPTEGAAGGLSDARVVLPASESHHALRVLRLGVGDAVEVFDGRGGCGPGVIAVAQADAVTVRLTGWRVTPAPRPELTMACAVPKGEKAEQMVDQLGQLGVDVFVPLLTERGVVDPRPGKVEKWRRLTLASAKQCGRDQVMQVREPIAVERWLASLGAGELGEHRYIAMLGETQAMSAKAQRVTVMIGPEGDWTPGEAESARSMGFVPCSLGPFVLRVETAACAAAALMRGPR